MKTRTSSQKAFATSGNVSLNTSASKNVSRTSGQPGAGQDQRREAAEDDDGGDRRDQLPAAGGASLRRLALGAAVAPDAALGCAGRLACYSRTGALVAWLIHCFSIAGSSPESIRFWIACETQSVSGESFSSRAPQVSPPGAANWPTTAASGTWTAVR